MMDELRRLQRSISASLLAIVLMLGICGLNDPAVAQTAPPRPRDPGLLYISPGAAVSPDAVAPVDDLAWRRSIASHVHLIATRENLAAILNNPNLELRKTKWFAGFKNPADALGWLEQNVQVAPIPDSALIQISIAGQIDPADAAKIIRELGNDYIDSSRTAATQQLLSKINVLTQMKTRWEAAIRNARNKSLENARQLQLDGFGSPRGGGQLEQELTLLTTERMKAERDAQDAKGTYDTALQTIQQGGTPAVVDRMSHESAAVVDLRARLHELETAGATPIPTTLPATQVELKATLQKRLDDLMDQERKRNSEAYLQALRGQVDGTQHYLDEVNKQIEKHRTDLAEMSARLAEYQTVKNEEEGLQEQLRQVQRQLDMLNTMSNEAELNQVRWASQPGAIVNP